MDNMEAKSSGFKTTERAWSKDVRFETVERDMADGVAIHWPTLWWLNPWKWATIWYERMHDHRMSYLQALSMNASGERCIRGLRRQIGDLEDLLLKRVHQHDCTVTSDVVDARGLPMHESYVEALCAKLSRLEKALQDSNVALANADALVKQAQADAFQANLGKAEAVRREEARKSEVENLERALEHAEAIAKQAREQAETSDLAWQHCHKQRKELQAMVLKRKKKGARRA